MVELQKFLDLTGIYYYDVNSLYPFVALNKMPGLNCSYYEFYDTHRKIDDSRGFFYCKIEVRDNYLGLLPYRDKSGLCFPNGVWFGR